MITKSINLNDYSVKEVELLIGRKTFAVEVRNKEAVVLFCRGFQAPVRVHIKKIKSQ